MTNFFKSLFIIIFLANFISCGNKEEEKEDKELQYIDIQEPITDDNKVKVITQPAHNSHLDSIAVKTSILRKQKYKRKKENTATDSVIPTIKNPKSITENTVINKNIHQSAFVLKTILDETQIGETLTQKELVENQNIPKEAVKLVKSITKLSNDELAVKWHSTWLVEKMSDAKFKDGKIKLRFTNNTMYTSGDAIGIKYKKKIYNDLVISGRKVKIPNVKGFYWEVGK